MADRFPLSRLAADASDRPFFFGYALRQYATRQLWTNAQLATWLGCSADTLVQLRLCRTPADGTGCEQIAERFGVPVAKLREVIGL